MIPLGWAGASKCDCDLGKGCGEKMQEGRERAYIGHKRTVLVRFIGLHPVQT